MKIDDIKLTHKMSEFYKQVQAQENVNPYYFKGVNDVYSLLLQVVLDLREEEENEDN